MASGGAQWRQIARFGGAQLIPWPSLPRGSGHGIWHYRSRRWSFPAVLRVCPDDPTEARDIPCLGSNAATRQRRAQKLLVGFCLAAPWGCPMLGPGARFTNLNACGPDYSSSAPRSCLALDLSLDAGEATSTCSRRSPASPSASPPALDVTRITREALMTYRAPYEI